MFRSERGSEQALPSLLFLLLVAIRSRLVWSPVCLAEIKSGYIRDAIRRGLDGKEYALPSLRCAIGAHPCPRPSACASHYSSERKISESGADVPRLRQ